VQDIRFDVVAFDLDGTLADTSPDIASALNHVLDRFGRRQLPEDVVRTMVGQGVKALLRKGFAATGESSEALVEDASPLFFEHYSEHICEGTRPFDGVNEALHALGAKGASLAICTNKPDALTNQLVEALGWNGLFSAVVGPDTLGIRKPDPAPLHEAVRIAGGGSAVFVGDSITDADTAKAAGLPLVVVSFGFSDCPAEELGAEAVIDHYRELIPALSRL